MPYRLISLWTTAAMAAIGVVALAILWVLGRDVDQTVQASRGIRRRILVLGLAMLGLGQAAILTGCGAKPDSSAVSPASVAAEIAALEAMMPVVPDNAPITQAIADQWWAVAQASHELWLDRAFRQILLNDPELLYEYFTVFDGAMSSIWSRIPPEMWTSLRSDETFRRRFQELSDILEAEIDARVVIPNRPGQPLYQLSHARETTPGLAGMELTETPEWRRICEVWVWSQRVIHGEFGGYPYADEASREVMLRAAQLRLYDIASLESAGLLTGDEASLLAAGIEEWIQELAEFREAPMVGWSCYGYCPGPDDLDFLRWFETDVLLLERMIDAGTLSPAVAGRMVELGRWHIDHGQEMNTQYMIVYTLEQRGMSETEAQAHIEELIARGQAICDRLGESLNGGPGG
jgi:hypothetical protein